MSVYATPGQAALFDVLLEPTYIASSINNLEHQFQPDRKYSWVKGIYNQLICVQLKGHAFS